MPDDELDDAAAVLWGLHEFQVDDFVYHIEMPEHIGCVTHLITITPAGTYGNIVPTIPGLRVTFTKHTYWREGPIKEFRHVYTD